MIGRYRRPRLAGRRSPFHPSAIVAAYRGVHACLQTLGGPQPSADRGMVHRMARNQHLYFLVHASHERFKVGIATNPLLRWATIQPHAQTDFAESLVFDVGSQVRAKWAEETLHRALTDSRFRMPSNIAGHTEWFKFSAFDRARAYASSNREFLGISEGYTVSARPRPSSGGSERTRTRSRMSLAERIALSALHNESTAAMVEAYTSTLIASGALLGSAADKWGQIVLYLHRDRITPEEVLLSNQIPMWESGPRFAHIVVSIIHDDTFIRLAIGSAFNESAERDDFASWAQSAPGFERVRSALDRVIAAAPSLPVAHPARTLDPVSLRS